jgi:UDP-3-O-[3-hydroxymyristoyl] glucosamine N-acyltransferase
VQIGHNVRLGRCCVIVAQVGIAGSTILEGFFQVGGQAAIAGHVRVCQGSQIGAQALFAMFLLASAARGSPMQHRNEFFPEVATLKRMTRRSG